MTKAVKDMMDPVSHMVEAGADKIDKQGMLDKWLARARANGHDPSVELFTRIEVVHGARIGGVNVQLEAEAGGDSTRLPDDFVLGLYAVYNDPRTTPEERARIEAVLLWNRTAAGGNANAGKTP